jgi:PST family polysaccharide transporter
MSQPTNLYGKVADRVVFPAMAQVQDDIVRLKSAYVRGLQLTGLFGLPLTVLLYLCAPEIIGVLLGDRWLEVIPVFSALSIATFFRLSSRVSSSLLRATASIREMILSQILYALLVVAAAIAAVPHGLVAVGWAVALAIVCSFIFITWFSCRRTRTTFREFLQTLQHGIILAALSWAVLSGTLGVARSEGYPDIVNLVVACLAFGLLWAALFWAKPKVLIGEEGRKLASIVELGILRSIGRGRTDGMH